MSVLDSNEIETIVQNKHNNNGTDFFYIGNIGNDLECRKPIRIEDNILILDFEGKFADFTCNFEGWFYDLFKILMILRNDYDHTELIGCKIV